MFSTIFKFLFVGFHLIWRSNTFSMQKESDFEASAAKFEAFIRTYNKSYANEAEKLKRFTYFQQTLREIEILQKADTGTAVYEVNMFSDLSSEEYLKMYGMVHRAEDFRYDEDYVETSDDLTSYESVNNSASAPAKFDWRTNGVVTMPLDQGLCGACYAFATVAAVEILYSVKMKEIFQFSVQQIVDCTHIRTDPESNEGCVRGSAWYSFDYMIHTGLASLHDYEWRGAEGYCRLEPRMTVYKLKDFHEKFRSRTVESKLYKTIPVAPVVTRVNGAWLKSYKEGIVRLPDKECPRAFEAGSHILLVVGYGEEKISKSKKLPYYTVRNSHGTKWGENGYARVHRGENICGIGNYICWPEIF